MSKALFDVLCGVSSLEVSGTGIAFEGLVINQYKDNGKCLVEIKDVPREIKGSIDVLAFVGADLANLNLHGCKNLTGTNHWRTIRFCGTRLRAHFGPF